MRAHRRGRPRRRLIGTPTNPSPGPLPVLPSVDLLPPVARAELVAYPLTEVERAAHAGSPLGPAAGWYYGWAGAGMLALALHELTPLPLVGVLVDAGEIAIGDRPLELMLHVSVWSDGQLLGAAGLRPAPRDGGERLIAVGPERVRDFCAEIGGPDHDDVHAVDAARLAARILLSHMGRLTA
ncbi:MAG: hypothetical protein QOD81_92 [Solirubrobacteraceae bacterium]|nr:hypothetical protein [Solirubrobacteraceae bacterium]